MSLAALGRTWGRRGELSATSFTEGADRFRELNEVYLFGAPGAPGADRAVEVESVWEHRGLLIFKFRGIDSISDAEPLEGADVRIPRARRRTLAEGEYFQTDLVGCEVIDRASGERIGVVSQWLEYGGPSLLEVERPGEPLLIPFAKSICVEIDVPGRRILVDLPDGLKDINER